MMECILRNDFLNMDFLFTITNSSTTILSRITVRILIYFLTISSEKSLFKNVSFKKTFVTFSTFSFSQTFEYLHVIYTHVGDIIGISMMYRMFRCDNPLLR